MQIIVGLTIHIDRFLRNPVRSIMAFIVGVGCQMGDDDVGG